MEVGRVIFIINRGLIENPAVPTQRVEIKCQVLGMQEPTLKESIALISAINQCASKLANNILSTHGMQSDHQPTNGGVVHA